MKVFLKKGIDKLLFGMKKADVQALYGVANSEFIDEEDNVVLVYFKEKVRLTFYKEEGYKLGYIVTANPEVTLLEEKCIGKNISELKATLANGNVKFKFEIESIDTLSQHFDESHWIILQSEFDEVVKVELGAMIENDEFVWAFNK